MSSVKTWYNMESCLLGMWFETFYQDNCETPWFEDYEITSLDEGRKWWFEIFYQDTCKIHWFEDYEMNEGNG